MGLILRQQLNDTNPSGISITGSALSYAQADSNFIYLLTNMSGSNISITGSTGIRGNITTTGNITMIGPQQIFGTASWALNTLANLHQVTTNGNITTNAIALTSSNALHELVLVPLDSFSGNEPAIYIKANSNTEYHKMTIDGHQMGYGGESLTLTKPASLPVGGTTLTYPTSSGIFAVSVNETASNAGGNITLTTVPTASFITASNVWGPHGTSSVLSSSYAISASWAPSISIGSFLTTGSLTITQQLSGSLDITGSLNFFSGSTNASKIENGWVILSQVSASLDFANDTAAAAGGVPLGGLYRSGSIILIRII
jgi:hypothetical protein